MAEASQGGTTVEWISDRELKVTRRFGAPVRAVYAAWSQPDLFRQWWVPKSVGMTMLACAMDVRTGGSYRLEFRHPDFAAPMAFFGRYVEVVPDQRIVWTNEESDGGAETSVDFAATDGGTAVTYREVYPTTEPREAAQGAEEALPEQFLQLDALLRTQGARED
jgi:uncharacterized protein YndB with AHSA1/START domain